MATSDLTFRLARLEDLDEITQVATAAYGSTSGLMRAATGDNVKDLAVPFHRATIGAMQVAGENWIALDGDKIVALAGWFLPGNILNPDDPVQAAAGFEDFCAKMTPELEKWWESFLPQYNEMCRKALGADRVKDMWQLQMLCTHPDYQRRGIASRLVKHKENLVLLPVTLVFQNGSLIYLQIASEGKEMRLETGYPHGVSVLLVSRP
ncbi:hypothetical protein BXZ70DRAFT_175069 [Cristinia sonorae]|uniref:N-acetyltransferase domain-containing protein n=1 Tax=Cristinia sonorae TaxID=1940300 RepID=A0A8K0UMR5_9AGAR|nr:hypothetical protein BXZ70DRAFT_175069 [Cristinia sonorae]